MRKTLFIFVILLLTGCPKQDFFYMPNYFSVINQSYEETKEHLIIKSFTWFKNSRLATTNHMSYRPNDWKIPAGKHTIKVDILYDDKSIKNKDYDIASSTFSFDVDFQHGSFYVVNASVEGEMVTSWIENSKQEKITPEQKNILSYYDIRDCQYSCRRITVSKFD